MASKNEVARNYATSPLLTDDPLDIPRLRNALNAIANGSSINAASRECGVSHNTIKKALRTRRAQRYIEVIRSENAQEMEISRKDVLAGFVHAVRQADTMAEPLTQIQGWKEIGRMLGYYAPEKHEHEHKGQIEHMHKQVEDMSTEELEEYVGGEVIDGEFEEKPVAEGGTPRDL